MNDTTYKKLNSTETIINAMPRLIEAFVTFYGESERENIKNKFKNLLVIGYNKPEGIERILRKEQEQKSNELIEIFLTKLNIESEKQKEAKEIYFGNQSLDSHGLHPIYQYIAFINGATNYKKQAVNFASKLYPQVTIENIDEMISTGKLAELNKVIEEYKVLIAQYKEYKKNFKPYEDYVEKCKKLKDNLEKKYTKDLVDEFKHLFTEEELKQIEDELNKNYFSSLKYLNKKTRNYFGYSLNSEALIDSFSKENEQLLLTGKEWQKNSVIQDRISFFKNLGIDLGDNYESYLNRPDVEKLFGPLQDLAEQIITKRKELHQKKMNEYYNLLEEYKHNIERIEQAGLLDKEHGYNANAYERNGTFITTNIKMTDNGYIMYPILCLSMSGLEEHLDHALIHELNHVYELTLQKFEDNKYYGVSGWDLIDGEIYNERKEEVSLEERKEKRNYELFNEIINELIAQEITEILFASDGYVFNTKDDAKIKGGTSYETTKFLVRDFYNTYKGVIIESRKTGDMSKLFETIGKENFDSLNELFHIFNKHFNMFTFVDALESLKKGEVTEKSQILQDIITKRNEILAAMEEHSKAKSASL